MAQQPRKVAVLVDGSERSVQAFDWARKNLLHTGDNITFVSVIQPPADPVSEPYSAKARPSTVRTLRRRRVWG